MRLLERNPDGDLVFANPPVKTFQPTQSSHKLLTSVAMLHDRASCGSHKASGLTDWPDSIRPACLGSPDGRPEYSVRLVDCCFPERRGQCWL
jgi:hypothetical protein